MIAKIATIAAAGTVLGIGAASAQDFTLQPAYGIAKLSAGFEPHVVALLAGGDQSAAASIGGNCFGYVAEAPDLRVFYTAGALPLVISVESETDTTLVVRDPNGEWSCNDDFNGLNPRVAFAEPLSGQYDIWVGLYAEGELADATLTVFESDAPVALDWRLPPNYGTFDLVAGFTPDPFVLDLDAGGDLSAQGTAANCYGYMTAAPDVRINYTAGDYPLFFSVISDTDTTLVISDPAGNWICNDDANETLNPEIVFDSPQSGQYDIWIGTFSSGPTAPATLYVSEIGGQTPGGQLNWDLEPNYGEVDLTAGFTPDPHVVELAAGGDVDASVLGGNCRGYVTSAPDFRVHYQSGGFPLTIYVEAEADTTLIIADPDGNWVCDDDTNGVNPQITFDAPLNGQYDIWVGTYGTGDTPPATLYITELGGGAENGDGVIDWALPPVFGEVELAAGFVPDPFTAEVTAGGNLSAATADPSCAGSVTAGPSFRLFYESGAFPLYIWVEADADTTLLISDPNGNWICDDDGGAVFLSPALGFDNPLSGQYDIWVGTFGGSPSPATLNISETIDGRAGASAPQPPSPPPSPPPGPASAPLPPSGPVFLDVAALDWTLAPSDGELTLAAGFSPDPTTLDVQAGGDLTAADAAGAACAGLVSASPNVWINYTSGAWPLILSVASEADTTLVVRTPEGEWICDDDSGGSLNPSVRFDAPTSGQYAIWVGAFTDGRQAASLYVSELTTQ
jgi:hypothetical protein